MAEHPLRERLRRPADPGAVPLRAAGRSARGVPARRGSALVEELGLEPGRELRALEQAILRPGPLARRPRRPARGAAAVPGRRAGAFVGRERELDELLTALADAVAGRGGLVLVGGEPGIGKSRLADELAGRAEELGARVLSGRCWEAGGAPAYWPWVQSLRAYVREREPEPLRAELGLGAPDLAQVLPELRELFPELPEPPTLAPEGARFRLFDSVATFLRTVARARPLLLVLDDLHAADAPSLLLLEFIANELDGSRLMILGAYRDTEIGPDHQLAATLAELARDQATQRVMLEGLSEAAVSRYIELSTGVVAPGSLVAAVHRGTEGNPLFLGELARLLGDEQLLELGTLERFPIPQGVHDAIAHRLRRLSERCRQVLGLASGLGREFSTAALERVSGTGGDALLELLDEALAARVVGEVPGARNRLRFSHALVRDALYEQLGASRRVRLHAEIGEALLSLYARDPEPHLAEIAHHFLEAAPGGDRERAIDYARRAADRAGRLLAYEEAARLYGMALAALDSTESADEPTRCELLLALGEAQARSGEMAPAKETFEHAADAASRLSLPGLLARAAIGYGGRFVWVRAGNDRRLVPLLESALAALPNEDSALRVKLLARLAGALRDQPSPRPVEAISNEAVEMARRLGDPATLAYALDGLYAGIRYPQQTAEWRAMADELVQSAERAGDKERAWAGHQHRLGPLMLAGDLESVDAELRAMEQVADELRQPAQLWAHSLSQTQRALFAGQFEDAEALIERNRELGRRAQTPDITSRARGSCSSSCCGGSRAGRRTWKLHSSVTPRSIPGCSSIAARSRLCGATRDAKRRHARSWRRWGPTISSTCLRGRSGSSELACSPRSACTSAPAPAPLPFTNCCSPTPIATCSTGSRSVPARPLGTWASLRPRCPAGETPSGTSRLRSRWIAGRAGGLGWRTHRPTTLGCSRRAETRLIGNGPGTWLPRLAAPSASLACTPTPSE